MSLSYGKARKSADIKWIVVHYPAAPGKDATWCKKYYVNCKSAKSAHYAVSQNETVSIVPCEFVAFHCATKVKDCNGKYIKLYCGATNQNSIGIDLMDEKINKKSMSAQDKDWFIPPSTLDRAAYLIAFLMKRFDIDIEHVVRHYDVTHKLCPRPLVGDDINECYGISGNHKWEQFKQLIMEKL